MARGREMKRPGFLSPVLREKGQSEGWSYCAERVPTTSSLPPTPAISPCYGGGRKCGGVGRCCHETDYPADGSGSSKSSR